MKAPRGLTTAEQTAWAHLASSVNPLPGKARPSPPPSGKGDQPKASQKPVKPSPKPRVPPQPRAAPGGRLPRGGEDPGLDSHWDRRVKGGRLEPDLTLDLHGHTLDTAYDRIMAGLDQARLMGARVVLVVAGRERPVDPADRMTKRGAIRAKMLDWLAASRHGSVISAVRRAHTRHGGDGALYLILKRG
jgi:DNA-nicking Smr family endonuclease